MFRRVCVLVTSEVFSHVCLCFGDVRGVQRKHVVDKSVVVQVMIVYISGSDGQMKGLGFGVWV